MLELYLLSELDTQRYEPDGIDEDIKKLYEKVRDFNNLEFEVKQIMNKLKGGLICLNELKKHYQKIMLLVALFLV